MSDRERNQTSEPDAHASAIDDLVDDPGEWMSTREAADLLGCSTSTLRRRIDVGEIPHATKAGHFRVPRRVIEAEVQDRSSELSSTATANTTWMWREAVAMRSIGLKSSDELPPLLTPLEIAGYLGVGVRQIRRSLERGSIPSIKIGSRHMMPKAAFIEMLTQTSVA